MMHASVGGCVGSGQAVADAIAPVIVQGLHSAGFGPSCFKQAKDAAHDRCWRTSRRCSTGNAQAMRRKPHGAWNHALAWAKALMQCSRCMLMARLHAPIPIPHLLLVDDREVLEGRGLGRWREGGGEKGLSVSMAWSLGMQVPPCHGWAAAQCMTAGTSAHCPPLPFFFQIEAALGAVNTLYSLEDPPPYLPTCPHLAVYLKTYCIY